MAKAKRLRLTKTTVEALSKPGYVWDSELLRFGVRVRVGGGRHYVVRLRVDGRQRWYTIGMHGDPWTVEMARAEARRVLGQGAHVAALRETGQAPANILHPIEAREASRAGLTLAEFAQRYMAEHSIPHKAPATSNEDLGLLGLRDKPPGEQQGRPRPTPHTIIKTLGTARLDRITRADITR
jgi:hypothetical protein